MAPIWLEDWFQQSHTGCRSIRRSWSTSAPWSGLSAEHSLAVKAVPRLRTKLDDAAVLPGQHRGVQAGHFAELRVEPFSCGRVIVHDCQSAGADHPAVSEFFACAGNRDRASGVSD